MLVAESSDAVLTPFSLVQGEDVQKMEPVATPADIDARLQSLDAGVACTGSGVAVLLPDAAYEFDHGGSWTEVPADLTGARFGHQPFQSPPAVAEDGTIHVAGPPTAVVRDREGWHLFSDPIVYPVSFAVSGGEVLAYPTPEVLRT